MASRKLRSTAQRAHSRTTGVCSAPLQTAYCVTAIFALAFYCYAEALKGPFVFDDLTLRFASPLSGPEPLLNWITEVRPVLMFSYWMNYVSSASSPFGYHLTNVCLHAINGVLFFLTGERLLRMYVSDNARVLAGAAFATSIFLLHPLQTESVAYVAGRSEVLSGTFVLLVWWLYSKADRPVSWLTSALVLLFAAIASATKEQAVVTVPAVLLLTDWYLRPGPLSSAIRANWRVYAPLGAIAAVGTAWVTRILVSSVSAGMNIGVSSSQYFYTECRAVLGYLQMFLLPIGQNADHDFPVSHNILEHGALFALIALSAGVVLLLKQQPLIRYGGLLFLAFLAPTSSFIPLADPFVEHRMYLPIAGLALATGMLVAGLRLSIQSIAFICMGSCVVGSAITAHRNKVWSDPVLFWQDVVAKSPHKSRGYPHLTHAYIVAGRCEEAVRHLERVTSIVPNDYFILYNWARAHACANELDPALRKLREAGKLMQTADVYALMGSILAVQQKTEQALEAFEKAIAKEPPETDLFHVYRGHMLRLRGQRDAAETEYRRALALNPYSPEALTELRRMRSVVLGNYAPEPVKPLP
jgi:Flp pilus assembly protein TadD